MPEGAKNVLQEERQTGYDRDPVRFLWAQFASHEDELQRMSGIKG